MDKTVSIIIPVYNSERYLNRCLDSVLSQRYTHLEVLLIDDGSTDHSLNICREYAAKDNRIRVVHQDNQGASAARNTGLDHATGEYIMFCDSDDMVSDMWVQRMINALSDEETIMPFTGICDGVEQLGTKNERPEIGRLMEKSELFQNKFYFLVGFNVNTIFKKSIVERIQNRFRCQQDKADYNEDLLFVTEYLKNVDRLTFLGYNDYVYCGREDSLSKKYTPYYYEKFAEKYQIWMNLIDLYADSSQYAEISTFYLYHFLTALNQEVQRNNYKRFKEIASSDSLRKCLRYSDTSKENPRVIGMLSKEHLRVLWIYFHLNNIMRK